MIETFPHAEWRIALLTRRHDVLVYKDYPIEARPMGPAATWLSSESSRGHEII